MRLRRWKGGQIEPHPTDKALIVNYQLEAAVFGEPNNPMVEEKRVSLEPIDFQYRSMTIETCQANGTLRYYSCCYDS